MCVKLNMFCVLRSYSDYQFFTDIIWMMYKILQWTMQKQIKIKKCKKQHFKNTKKNVAISFLFLLFCTDPLVVRLYVCERDFFLFLSSYVIWTELLNNIKECFVKCVEKFKKYLCNFYLIGECAMFLWETWFSRVKPTWKVQKYFLIFQREVKNLCI